MASFRRNDQQKMMMRDSNLVKWAVRLLIVYLIFFGYVGIILLL